MLCSLGIVGSSRAAGARHVFVAGLAGALVVSSASAAPTTSVRIRLDGVGDTTTPGVGSTVSAASGSASFGGVAIQANALSGAGSLSTFASGVGGTSHPFFVTALAQANAAFGDTITINADGNVQDALVFRFLLSATGSVSGSAPPNREVFARSEFNFTFSTPGGSPSSMVGGRIAGARTVVLPSGFFGIEQFDEPIGLGFGVIAADIVFLRSLAGDVGMPVSVSFSSLSRVSFSGGGGFNNGNFSAIADFGSTLRWIGLESVRYQDGTPYTGGYSVTSASGFDYTTPTPGAASSLLIAGVLAACRRRR